MKEKNKDFSLDLCDCITPQQLELLEDFLILYNKLILKRDNSFLTYYDKQLFEILEEYDFLILCDYKKDYLLRSFDDF